MRGVLVLGCAAALLSGCGKPLWRVPTPPVPALSEAPLPPATDPEYGVYASLLRSWGRLGEERQARVADTTMTPRRRRPEPKVPAEFVSAVADMQAKAAHPRGLVPTFAPDVQVTLHSGGVLAILKPDAPGGRGFVGFSRVGFNGDTTRAVVYVVQVCGGRCGSTRLVLLARAPGKAWTRWSEILLSVS